MHRAIEFAGDYRCLDRVQVIEPTGSETILILDAGGKEIVMTMPERCDLGAGTAALAEVQDGSGNFAASLEAAERPMIILGAGAMAGRKVLDYSKWDHLEESSEEEVDEEREKRVPSTVLKKKLLPDTYY